MKNKAIKNKEKKIAAKQLESYCNKSKNKTLTTTRNVRKKRGKSKDHNIALNYNPTKYHRMIGINTPTSSITHLCNSFVRKRAESRAFMDRKQNEEIKLCHHATKTAIKPR